MSDSSRFSPIADARPQDVRWAPLRWPPARDTRLFGRVTEVSPVISDRDASAVFEALNDDRVWQHLAVRPESPEAFAEVFAEEIGSGDLPWVVRLRTPYAGMPAGAVVGTSSYLEVSVPDARLEIGATAYAPSVWGTAVNPDVKLVLLAHAFDVLGAGRVQLKTDVRNVRSQQAIARLGARYEGTLRRYQRRADDTIRDTVLFSITAEDWPAIRAGLERRLDVAIPAVAGS